VAFDRRECGFAEEEEEEEEEDEEDVKVAERVG